MSLSLLTSFFLLFLFYFIFFIIEHFFSPHLFFQRKDGWSLDSPLARYALRPLLLLILLLFLLQSVRLQRPKQRCFRACSLKKKKRPKRLCFGLVFLFNPFFWYFSTQHLSQSCPSPSCVVEK